ncbi:MAG: hypothetical protein N2170_08860 [Bacteroidia bacterium]|nr:hypothetical protein [Bacteroidia bacterium]
MRYAQYIIGTALMWAVVACSSGPSQQFIQQVSSELNDLKGVTEKLNALKGEVANLQDPFAGLKGELGKVWTDKVEKDKELAEKVSQLTEQAKQLTEQVTSLEGQLNSALSEAQSFVDGLATQQKKEEELKTDWEAIKGKVSGVAGQVEQLSQQLAQLKQEVQAHSEAIKSKYAPKK